uniref:Uncharacterized protein n=1 Tax=Macaca nemestrina TaxID=9545 RepID=A0A2K6CXZ8_MACNE
MVSVTLHGSPGPQGMTPAPVPWLQPHSHEQPGGVTFWSGGRGQRCCDPVITSQNHRPGGRPVAQHRLCQGAGTGILDIIFTAAQFSHRHNLDTTFPFAGWRKGTDAHGTEGTCRALAGTERDCLDQLQAGQCSLGSVSVVTGKGFIAFTSFPAISWVHSESSAQTLAGLDSGDVSSVPLLWFVARWEDEWVVLGAGTAVFPPAASGKTWAEPGPPLSSLPAKGLVILVEASVSLCQVRKSAPTRLPWGCWSLVCQVPGL